MLEPFEPKVILTKAMIEAEGLSKLYRIPSGASYAFTEEGLQAAHCIPDDGLYLNSDKLDLSWCNNEKV